MFRLHEDGTEAGYAVVLVLVWPRTVRKESAGDLGQGEMKIFASGSSEDLLCQPGRGGDSVTAHCPHQDVELWDKRRDPPGVGADLLVHEHCCFATGTQTTGKLTVRGERQQLLCCPQRDGGSACA